MIFYLSKPHQARARRVLAHLLDEDPDMVRWFPFSEITCRHGEGPITLHIRTTPDVATIEILNWDEDLNDGEMGGILDELEKAVGL